MNREPCVVDDMSVRAAAEAAKEEDEGGGGGGANKDGASTGSQAPGVPGRAPLKTILLNFLNHVSDLEARKSEGENTYEKEFQVRNIRILFCIILAIVKHEIVAVICASPCVVEGETFLHSEIHE